MFMERLKSRREFLGLSQTALAREIGVGRDSYNKYERAGINPSQDTLVLLARALDTSVDYLLGITDDPTPSYPLSPTTAHNSNIAQGNNIVQGNTITQTITDPALSGKESDLLRIFRDLDFENAIKLANYALKLEKTSAANKKNP